MAYKTCPDCGELVYNLGCTNCNELAYIEEQDRLTDLYGSDDEREIRRKAEHATVEAPPQRRT